MTKNFEEEKQRRVDEAEIAQLELEAAKDEKEELL